MEIWKDIPGYEGFYQASSEGRVRSLDRIGGLGRKYKGVILSQGDNGIGYKVAMLTTGGRKLFTVHNLVASAFLGKKPKCLVVDHIDSNRANNNISNLQYISQRENANKSERVIATGLPPGVDRVGDRYRSKIFLNGVHATIGSFASIEAASNSYKYAIANGLEKARELFLHKKTSKFVGVSFCRTHGIYRATATINKKQINLGRYDNEQDALTARLAWEKSLAI